jgi:O-antigen/teichoic acid export membrane protein
MYLLDKFFDLFFKNQDARTLQASKNTVLTFLIKVVSLPISFVLLSLTINYVNTESYGLWITISSIVTWMSFFDIGINNGLRNKLTQSLAVGDYILSKKYVSTTYAILCIISTSILVLFVFFNFFIDWSYVLNTSPILNSELSKVSLVVVTYFCLKFVLSTLNVVLLSTQSSASASLVGFFEQFSSLVIIYLLIKFTSGNLLNLAFGLCLFPILVLLFLNFFFFVDKLKHISPSINFINFSLSKDLMGLGFKFFVIQIAGVIQFQTANFIIIQNFGASEVTIYNVAFKYFSILTMLMSILMIPLWSSVTDAFVKNDILWIKKAEIKFRKIACLIFVLGVFMLIFSNSAYELWLGENKVLIPFQISFWMFVFSIISVFGGVYCTILNGVSALNIQFKASFVSPFIFFICTYFFISYFKLGITSIILASIIANFNGYLLAPLQFRSIFYKNKDNFIN